MRKRRRRREKGRESGEGRRRGSEKKRGRGQKRGERVGDTQREEREKREKRRRHTGGQADRRGASEQPFCSRGKEEGCVGEKEMICVACRCAVLACLPLSLFSLSSSLLVPCSSLLLLLSRSLFLSFSLHLHRTQPQQPTLSTLATHSRQGSVIIAIHPMLILPACLSLSLSLLPVCLNSIHVLLLDVHPSLFPSCLQCLHHVSHRLQACSNCPLY